MTERLGSTTAKSTPGTRRTPFVGTGSTIDRERRQHRGDLSFEIRRRGLCLDLNVVSHGLIVFEQKDELADKGRTECLIRNPLDMAFAVYEVLCKTV